MRKLKFQIQISLDGYIAGPNGEMDWLTWNWDDDLNDYVKEITEPVDLILLGRVLAEGFIPVWKERSAAADADVFTHKMVDIPKMVFSRTLKEHIWENTALANGDVVEEIKHLKAQPGGDIVAYGGARFAASLIRHNLIDEYHLFVNPVAIGKGMPIFNELENKLDLKLVKSQRFKCGITVLCYTPVVK